MHGPQSEQGRLGSRPTDDKDELKGTFVAVMMLGAFIIVSWVGVWALYIAR